MELLQILRVLLRRWYLVLIPPVIVGIITLPSRFQPAQSGGYKTTIRYTAAQVLNIPERDGDYQDVWLASELTVNALTDWVRTSSFAQEVAEIAAENGLQIEPLAIPIAADNARSIGVLELAWHNPDELQIIAEAAITVLQTQTHIFFPQLENEPARVRILDMPIVSPAPPPLTDRFSPFIKLGLGVIMGLGLAFLAEYFDQTLRTKDDLTALGISVVGSIPRYRKPR